MADHVGPFSAKAVYRWLWLSARDGLQSFKREPVLNIQSFEAETPTGTVPMERMRVGLQDIHENYPPLKRLDDLRNIRTYTLYFLSSDVDT